MAAMGRTILYADPSVDITPYVIHWLNQRYKESGGAAPKATTTALPASPTSQPRGTAPANRTPAPRRELTRWVNERWSMIDRTFR